MTAIDEKEVLVSEDHVDKSDSSLVIDKEFENIVNNLAPTRDDISIPSMTFRVWLLGTIFCVTLSAVNTIFMFRTNPYSLTSYVATLLSYPLGVTMANYIPHYKFNVLGLFTLDTNPGPFSVKEHVLIGIFGSTGAAGIYGVDNLVVQEVFYNLDIGHYWGVLFLLTSSTLGFGISGICRRFLVRPRHMIWPSVLPSVALYTALHHVKTDATKDSDKQGESKRHMSQLTCFTIGLIGMALWQIFPSYIANMLQFIPLLCWVTPSSNLQTQRLGSPLYGPGIFSFTLDWTAVGSSYMSMPFWAALNNFVNLIIFVWIIIPVSYYGNWFNQPKSEYPDRWNTSLLMDKDFKPFKGIQVVDDTTHELIIAKYEERKPVHFSTHFAFAYFGHFASLLAATTHTIVWHGKDIVSRFRAARQDEDGDIHCQLIDKYPDVPDTWYYGFFVITCILSVIVGQLSEIQMPWWATFLVIALSFSGTIPIAVVLATAGVQLYMNVISQFIIGLILPGKPIVMMAFKCFGVTVSMQCIQLLFDLKLGHYMKVPPRHIFYAQMYSQLMAVVFCYATMRIWLASPEHYQWVKANGNKKMAGSDLGAQWGGYGFNVYNSASLIWGAIGPKRFFFEGEYAPIIWAGALTGFVLPLVLKALHKVSGAQFIRLIHPAIILSPASPGANQGANLSAFLIAFICQWYIFRFHQGTWRRYNYILATAFDIGAAITTLIITFAFKDVSFPTWFLNTGEAPLPVHGNNENYLDWCYTASS